MHSLTLNDEERTLLIELVEARVGELSHEIHQTDSQAFRKKLQGISETLTQMLRKLKEGQ